MAFPVFNFKDFGKVGYFILYFLPFYRFYEISFPIVLFVDKEEFDFFFSY
jgi:hypothetical protein